MGSISLALAVAQKYLSEKLSEKSLWENLAKKFGFIVLAFIT